MTERVELRDGRVLAYAEYGAPGGKPVLYFHGHPGSRLEWPSFDRDGLAAELGARIVAIDRPGHGGSDFQTGRRLLDWASDVTELADALSLDRFAVLGVSGGAPYAAVCGHEIPERLTAIAIVSGMGPSDAPGAKTGTAWKFAAGRSSLMRSIVLMLMSLGLRHKPEAFESQMRDAVEGPDRALLVDHPELAGELIERLFCEGFRTGISGVRHEAGLYASPWGFRLEDIGAKVDLWHGGQDGNVPISVGRAVADALPNCRARFLEDEGHMSLPYRHMREVLAVLVGG